MRSDVKLSTRFITTQNAHQVGLLLDLTGDTPTRRPPINVALVLDRSGSMAGQPIAAAHDAARRFASFLGRDDRLTIVGFDGQVETVFGPAPAGDPAAAAAISRLDARGSTNLSAGWLKGMQHVQSGLVDGTNRVVLLTDGQANQGVTDISKLTGMAGGASAKRVTTTCIGFGAGFNEELLQPMARAGGGNYWFVESNDQMTGIFESEIEGLVSLAAQNVEVEISLTHPRAAWVCFLQAYPVQATPAGTWRVTIGDLYATSPLALGLRFHVENVTELGKVEVAQVRVEADVVTEQGIEHRTVVMPVIANLDAEDHVEPMVERTFLRFEVAQAREAAIRDADRGKYDSAAAKLQAAAQACAPYANEASVAEEIEDLRAQAELLESRVYSAMDRKYDAARSMAAMESKLGYVEKMRRQR